MFTKSTLVIVLEDLTERDAVTITTKKYCTPYSVSVGGMAEGSPIPTVLTVGGNISVSKPLETKPAVNSFILKGGKNYEVENNSFSSDHYFPVQTISIKFGEVGGKCNFLTYNVETEITQFRLKRGSDKTFNYLVISRDSIMVYEKAAGSDKPKFVWSKKAGSTIIGDDKNTPDNLTKIKIAADPNRGSDSDLVSKFVKDIIEKVGEKGIDLFELNRFKVWSRDPKGKTKEFEFARAFLMNVTSKIKILSETDVKMTTEDYELIKRNLSEIRRIVKAVNDAITGKNKGSIVLTSDIEVCIRTVILKVTPYWNTVETSSNGRSFKDLFVDFDDGFDDGFESWQNSLLFKQNIKGSVHIIGCKIEKGNQPTLVPYRIFKKDSETGNPVGDGLKIMFREDGEGFDIPTEVPPSDSQKNHLEFKKNCGCCFNFADFQKLMFFLAPFEVAQNIINDLLEEASRGWETTEGIDMIFKNNGYSKIKVKYLKQKLVSDPQLGKSSKNEMVNAAPHDIDKFNEIQYTQRTVNNSDEPKNGYQQITTDVIQVCLEEPLLICRTIGNLAHYHDETKPFNKGEPIYAEIRHATFSVEPECSVEDAVPSLRLNDVFNQLSKNKETDFVRQNQELQRQNQELQRQNQELQRWKDEELAKQNGNNSSTDSNPIQNRPTDQTSAGVEDHEIVDDKGT